MAGVKSILNVYGQRFRSSVPARMTTIKGMVVCRYESQVMKKNVLESRCKSINHATFYSLFFVFTTIAVIIAVAQPLFV